MTTDAIIFHAWQGMCCHRGNELRCSVCLCYVNLPAGVRLYCSLAETKLAETKHNELTSGSVGKSDLVTSTLLFPAPWIELWSSSVASERLATQPGPGPLKHMHRLCLSGIANLSCFIVQWYLLCSKWFSLAPVNRHPIASVLRFRVHVRGSYLHRGSLTLWWNPRLPRWIGWIQLLWVIYLITN